MNKYLFGSVVPLFAAAIVAGGVFSSSLDAEAYEVSSAARCFIEQDFDEDYFFNRGVGNQSNGLGSRPRRVICPVTDNTAQPRSGISSVFVSGFDGHNGTDENARVRVGVVLTQFNGLGYAFAWQDATTGTFTGGFDSGLNSSLLNFIRSQPSWYATLQVMLPQRGPVGDSQLYGHTIF